MTHCSNFMKLDSVSHLSFDSKQGLILGKGLTKGTESDYLTIINTESGGIERIKAGKIPVIVFGNTTLQEKEENKLKKFRVLKRNSKLLSKVNKNGRDTLKTVSGIRSVPTLGNLNSE